MNRNIIKNLVLIQNVIQKINDTNAKIVQLQAAVTDLQNGGGGGTGGIGLRDIIVYDGVGGSTLTYASNGTIAYSLNQSPGQIIIDADVQSPPVGTEFIIYAGSNNTAYIKTLKRVEESKLVVRLPIQVMLMFM